MKNFLFVVIILLPVWSGPGYPADDPQSLMSRWLDLENQKGKLQSQWRERETILSRRLELMQIEVDAIEQALAQSNSSTSEVDARRQTLSEEQTELEREQVQLGVQLADAISRMQRLQPRLPPPLQAEWSEKLELASREDASNSQKLEKLLSLYQLLNEFNGRVAYHKTAMQIPGGTDGDQIMVAQIYLGLAQGWYISDDGSKTGFGLPTEQGWQWWQGDEASQILGRELDASALLKVKAMLETPTVADYVPLPVLVNTSQDASEGRR